MYKNIGTSRDIKNQSFENSQTGRYVKQKAKMTTAVYLCPNQLKRILGKKEKESIKIFGILLGVQMLTPKHLLLQIVREI